MPLGLLLFIFFTQKRIREALAVKKKLEKEYEKLAKQFEDIGIGASRHAPLDSQNPRLHPAFDTDWELL